ncbi:hypothetical protein BH10ACI2_BH10ACI2_12820 [soil metagenome]
MSSLRNNSSESSLSSHVVFFMVVIAIIAGAIVRSNITTGLDSFTYDEAYHIGAGAVYVKTGDFRLNPEQPPLTKLWTGAYVTLLGYKHTAFRAFSDKEDERDFVEHDAYFENDPQLLQARARTAMFALNGVLLFLFALAVRRLFGDVIAIGATLFLAIDPTVAAHFPVVMTDLPVALTSAIAVLTAAKAFQSWKLVDVVLASLSLGLALSAKHSGIITLIAVAVFGFAVSILFTKGANAVTRLKHFGLVAVVVLGGIATLWGFYGFRYNETPGTSEETFNRSLAEKTSDVRSPVFRGALNAVTTIHLFPRSYTWGMADTIRAGVEGRAIQVKAFGESYYSKAPFYFFPGIVAAKLPIGLLVLSLIGAGLLILRRVPSEFVRPILGVALLALSFLVFLIRGSSYAGVRHALPLFPFMALLGAIAIHFALNSKSIVYRGLVGVMLILAIVSAVPQMRPWEYFNEMAGGAANGSLYFNDEGVDLSQRIGEASEFYHRELEPKGEVPFLAYFSNDNDRKSRGMDYVGRDRERDDRKYDADTITGTFLIGANELGESTWWDVAKPFRGTQPTGRFGNLFVFQGTFARPAAMRARSLFYRTIYSKIYVGEPDLAAGIEGIESSLALDDSCFFVSLELGNQYLKAGNREQALRAYHLSLEKAPKTDSIYDLLAEQVRRIETEPLENIAPVRNPGIE